MRSPAFRSYAARFALVALAGGLTACGGGGGSTSLPPAASVQGAVAAMPFALGFVNADPLEIARMPVIRHELSVSAVPSAADLSAKMPAVGYQGQEGSCVAWATAYAMRGYEARVDVWSSIAPQRADAAVNFSPAFVYNQLNHGNDTGITIPSALSLLQQKGAATLADMPYVAGQYTTQPTAAAFADAAHYRLSTFGSIAPTDVASMKAQLAAGIPVILAIKVYSNFYALGPNQIYAGSAGHYVGGHAVTAVGYDESKQAVKFINSWGTAWGTAGYGWISYAALRQIGVEAYSAIDDHGAPKPGSAPAPGLTPKPAPAATAKPWPTATQRPRPAPVTTAKPKPGPTPKR
jgi:C1A family cysteine protease